MEPFLISCSRVDVAAILPIEQGGPDAGGLFDAKPNQEFCESSGICGGVMAEQLFRFALCSCEDYISSTALITDSFDSRRGPYAPGGTGGSVGVNRHINAGGPMTIGGSLWAGNPDGLQAGMAGDIEIAGELRSDGQVLSETALRVEHDAWVGGRVMARDLYVGGTLRWPPNEPLDVSGTQDVAATERLDFSIPRPCDCDRLIDVAALVAARAGDNDNASIGLDPAALGNVDGSSRLELPCGIYYLDRISGVGPLGISVIGRAALFIAGDISLEGALDVEVAPNGELDLFVAGAIVSAERLTLGSADHPANLRVYVGTAGTLQLSGGAYIAGNLYAPRAELVASAPIEAFGALFVRRLNASAEIVIHYDTAVLEAADGCDLEPPTSCTSCEDCRNNACTAGSCGVCSDSSECCAPLVCAEGACVPEL